MKSPKAKTAKNNETNTNADAPSDPQALAEVRRSFHETLGEIVGVMSQQTRYMDQTIGDIRSLVVRPLLQRCTAIARGSRKTDDGDQQLSAVAVWAHVSPEVEGKIERQIKAGVFPIKLQEGDWRSGEHVWVLDIIAPNAAMAEAVIGQLASVVKTTDVRLHPIVTRMLDPQILEKIGIKRRIG